jgi:hypothetical protein
MQMIDNKLNPKAKPAACSQNFVKKKSREIAAAIANNTEKNFNILSSQLLYVLLVLG